MDREFKIDFAAEQMESLGAPGLEESTGKSIEQCEQEETGEHGKDCITVDSSMDSSGREASFDESVTDQDLDDDSYKSDEEFYDSDADKDFVPTESSEESEDDTYTSDECESKDEKKQMILRQPQMILRQPQILIYVKQVKMNVTLKYCRC